MTFRSSGNKFEATLGVADRVAIAALALSIVMAIVGAAWIIKSELSEISERVARVETKVDHMERGR